MGLFSSRQDEPLDEQLARKRAELSSLQVLVNSLKSFPVDYTDRMVKLSGDIAVIELKIKAQKDKT